MNTELYYKKITESLRLLSLPFEEQIKCFPNFVEVPFEVLDTFNKAFLLSPTLIELGKFNNSIIANLLRLHNLINLTLNNPNFKDLEDEQFSKSSEWNKVRELSKEILQLMGEAFKNPDPKYI